MEGDEYFDDMDLVDKNFVISNAILRAHEDDPLNAELRCCIQPLTLKRLLEYVREHHSTLDIEVNDMLKAILYDEGY